MRQESQTRTGLEEEERFMLLSEQELQKIPPQALQWCCRARTTNRAGEGGSNNQSRGRRKQQSELGKEGSLGRGEGSRWAEKRGKEKRGDGQILKSGERKGSRQVAVATAA